jgi:hypothetical protein
MIFCSMSLVCDDAFPLVLIRKIFPLSPNLIRIGSCYYRRCAKRLGSFEGRVQLFGWLVDARSHCRRFFFSGPPLAVWPDVMCVSGVLKKVSKTRFCVEAPMDSKSPNPRVDVCDRWMNCAHAPTLFQNRW